VEGDGGFSLRGLPAEEVPLTVEVVAPGFLPLRGVAAPGKAFPLRLTPGVLLAGKVVGADGGPAARAEVRASEGNSVAVSEEGNFEIAVSSLPVSLEVEAPRHRPLSVRVEVPGDAALVKLVPGSGIRARLVDELERPIDDILLSIEQRSADGSRATRQRRLRSHDGTIDLDLPAASYRLRVRSVGFRQRPLPEISLADGESHDFGTIRLTRGATISGLMADGESGEAVAGVAIAVIPQGNRLMDAIVERSVGRAVSKSDGRFAVSGLASGRFEIRAERSGYATTKAVVSLEDEVTEDVGVLQMTRGADVRGRVTSRDGSPRGGVTVRLFDAELGTLLPLTERTTDGDGRFAGPFLAPGAYRVQVVGDQRRVLLSQEVEVVPSAKEVSLELVVQGVRLSGWITREGSPMAGGHLRLSSALDPAHRQGKVIIRLPSQPDPITLGLPRTEATTTVDGQGYFELGDVASGALWLSYQNDEVFADRLIVVPDRPRAEIVVEIDGCDLRGRLVDEEGLGVQGSVVALDELTAREVAGVTAGDHGYFTLTQLEPRRYLLRASAQGFETSTHGVDVRPEMEPVVVRLRRDDGGRLVVKLRRPDGSGVGSAMATLVDGSGMMGAALRTDASGERVFESLAAGTYYLIWADPLAGVGISDGLRVVAGETVEYERILQAGASVGLACPVDACADAAPDLLALYTPSGHEIGSYMTGMSPALRLSPEGKLSIGRLSPGSYLLRLWVAGERWEKTLQVASEPTEILLP
jgi:hypothetical protein